MFCKDSLSLPLLDRTGGGKYDERLVGQNKDRERSLTNYHCRQNRLYLGKLVEYIINKTRVGY